MAGLFDPAIFDGAIFDIAGARRPLPLPGRLALRSIGTSAPTIAAPSPAAGLSAGGSRAPIVRPG